MKFIDFKERNSSNYNFFEADEFCYKGFIKLAFEEFCTNYPNHKWTLNIDDKRLNSYPNFTQKHQICISHNDFKDAVFQFRIACENSVNTLGYRLFINLDGSHLDFVSGDITQTDSVVIAIKTEILHEFLDISKCGWWITDIWRDLYPITDESMSENFISNIINSNFTSQMIQINKTLISMQKNGGLRKFIDQLKKQN